MLTRSLLTVATFFALEANAFWRLPCQQRLVLERVDPIESPGTVAAHVHAIHGAQNFAKESSHQDLRESECTSCAVTQDMSAYWTPNMYWEDADTKQLTALNQTGGMLVYYLQRHSEDDEPAEDGSKLHIFPENFRMIAGDARMRNNTWREDMGFSGEDSVFDNKSLWSTEDRENEAMKRQDAIGFNCLNYQAPAEGALMRKGLPEDVSNCVDGLRAEIFFPSCWNGEDDSPNHKDHLRYPTLVQDGECPEGFKKRLPSLFYETIWDVDYAQGRNGRLVLSDGDATGFGYHGDFMNGWDQDVLRRAVNECTDPSGVVDMCPIFDLQSRDDQLKCMKTELEVDEEVFGPLDILPGCNAITGVGAYADMSTGCDGDAITGNEDEHVSEDVDNGSADYSDEEEEQNPDSEETPDDEAASSEEGEAAPVVDEAPVEEAPVEEAPVEEAPVEEAPVEEAPVEEAPVEEAPVEEAVAGEEAPAADASSSDPYLVVVTVTQYHQEQVVTQVAEADVVYETVSAAPVTEYVNAKRNTHRRRHAHGHKH